MLGLITLGGASPTLGGGGKGAFCGGAPNAGCGGPGGGAMAFGTTLGKGELTGLGPGVLVLERA